MLNTCFISHNTTFFTCMKRGDYVFDSTNQQRVGKSIGQEEENGQGRKKGRFVTLGNTWIRHGSDRFIRRNVGRRRSSSARPQDDDRTDRYRHAECTPRLYSGQLFCFFVRLILVKLLGWARHELFVIHFSYSVDF